MVRKVKDSLAGLADRMRIARAQTDLSQKKFAEMVGIPPGSWQKYEDGNAVPGAKVMWQMMAQGYNANWLLTGNGEMWLEEAVQEGRLPFDGSVISQIVTTIEEYLQAYQKSVTPDKKAALVCLIYEELMHGHVAAKSRGENAPVTVDKEKVIRLTALAC